jgi:hypothetical protein
LKRRKPAVRAARTGRLPEPARTRRTRQRHKSAAADAAGWSGPEAPEEDDGEALVGLDTLLPVPGQDPGLAARRRIEQLREEKWLHDALNDFPDA